MVDFFFFFFFPFFFLVVYLFSFCSPARTPGSPYWQDFRECEKSASAILSRFRAGLTTLKTVFIHKVPWAESQGFYLLCFSLISHLSSSSPFTSRRRWNNSSPLLTLLPARGLVMSLLLLYYRLTIAVILSSDCCNYSKWEKSC